MAQRIGPLGSRLGLGTAIGMRIVPLGGLGEIGMNCLAIEVGEDVVVVDCGVTFPRVDLGIDTYRPDLSWLEERRERVRGLILTHGHEDHIGAVSYFAERLEVPIHGPPYALELVRGRLAEHGFRDGEVDLRDARPGARITLGGIETEPIRVAHSIADALALVVRTKDGTVVHTGDFKLDTEPGDGGELTDEARLAEIGREGVRLLLSDSTNVDSHGRAGSEGAACRRLEELVLSAARRVVVGLFASNVVRLAALLAAARASGRKVALLGRSVQTHARIAAARGYLSMPSDLLLADGELAKTPSERVLVVAGGTQAERLAAMTKLSRREHPLLTLDRGDRVILSSRIIPGNEPGVSAMVGGFLRQGCELFTAQLDPGLHASGHAHRDEQRRMIELTEPRSFVPIHGTVGHLYRHAELARDAGVPEVLVVENGEIAALGGDAELGLTRDRAAFAKIATWFGEDVPQIALDERAALARSGVVLVTVVVDERGRALGAPSVATKGVIDPIAEADVISTAARDAARALDEDARGGRPRDAEIAGIVRSAVRRTFDSLLSRRPITLVNVVRERR